MFVGVLSLVLLPYNSTAQLVPSRTALDVPVNLLAAATLLLVSQRFGVSSGELGYIALLAWSQLLSATQLLTCGRAERDDAEWLSRIAAGEEVLVAPVPARGRTRNEK